MARSGSIRDLQFVEIFRWIFTERGRASTNAAVGDRGYRTGITIGLSGDAAA